jgi:hypothetical protein
MNKHEQEWLAHRGDRMTTTAAPAWIDFQGSTSTPYRRIGQVTLTEDHSSRRTFETASWYEDIDVPAGTSVELQSNGYYTSARFQGSQGASYFISSICASYGEAKLDERHGEPDSYRMSTYDFMAAEAILKGTFLGGASVVLDEDVRIIATPLKQEAYDIEHDRPQRFLHRYQIKTDSTANA